MQDDLIKVDFNIVYLTKVLSEALESSVIIDPYVYLLGMARSGVLKILVKRDTKCPEIEEALKKALGSNLEIVWDAKCKIDSSMYPLYNVKLEKTAVNLNKDEVNDYSINAEVIRAFRGKESGLFLYECGIINNEGRRLIPIGKTEMTEIEAKVGDLIKVKVKSLDMRCNEDGALECLWQAPIVESVVSDKEPITFFEEAKAISKVSGVYELGRQTKKIILSAKPMKIEPVIPEQIRSNQKLKKGEVRSKDIVMKIKGVALREGRFNGVFYGAEQLEKGHISLKNKPLRVDHNKSEIRGMVGKVVEVEWDDSTKKIYYEADIYDPYIATLIRNGLVKAVSVEMEVSIDEAGLSAKGYDPVFSGLSLVMDPACSTCVITDVDGNQTGLQQVSDEMQLT